MSAEVEPIRRALWRAWREVLGRGTTAATSGVIRRAIAHADALLPQPRGSLMLDAAWYAEALNHYYANACQFENSLGRCGRQVELGTDSCPVH